MARTRTAQGLQVLADPARAFPVPPFCTCGQHAVDEPRAHEPRRDRVRGSRRSLRGLQVPPEVPPAPVRHSKAEPRVGFHRRGSSAMRADRVTGSPSHWRAQGSQIPCESGCTSSAAGIGRPHHAHDTTRTGSGSGFGPGPHTITMAPPTKKGSRPSGPLSALCPPARPLPLLRPAARLARPRLGCRLPGLPRLQGRIGPNLREFFLAHLTAPFNRPRGIPRPSTPLLWQNPRRDAKPAVR